MPSINDKNFKNKELDEKVENFIRPKNDEINNNIDALVESAKVADLNIVSLQDIINLKLPESQEDYNFVADLQNCAKDLLKQQEEYLFLLKSNDEVMDYLDDHINQQRLELCAKKVFLYQQLGHDVDADDLEEELRAIAMAKRIKKKTLDKIFHCSSQQKQHKQEKDVEIDGLTEEMNQKHAAIIRQGKFQILTETKDSLILQDKKDFLNSYENHQILLVNKGTPETKATIWLKDKDRREYDKINFHPYNPCLQQNAQDTSPNNREYNLWKGFAVEPKEGDTFIFKSFVLDVICNGDEKHFKYLYSWLARLIQYPEKHGETAIILMGKQGTGKNTFVETVGKLLGVHYKPLANIEQLLGNFDFHHANAVLIHANEAIWGGDKKRLGKLKTLITEPEVTVEAKFKDPVTLKNCRHLIMSSNEEWPVHLDLDDRRFLVLKVSDSRKEDKNYFKSIRSWRENGGYETLLHELSHHDLSKFDVRDVPQSKISLDVKLRSLSNEHTYIYEVLLDGDFCLTAHNEESEDFMVVGSKSVFKGESFEHEKIAVYNCYVGWCEMQKIKDVTSAALFWKTWKKLIPSVNTDIRRRDDGRQKRYSQFPKLTQARKEFEKTFKSEGLVCWGIAESTEHKIAKIEAYRKASQGD